MYSSQPLKSTWNEPQKTKKKEEPRITDGRYRALCGTRAKHLDRAKVMVLRKKNNMDRLTPFSVLHHHNKKRSYYCGLVTCLNIPPSLSCPFRVFHPPNKCGVIHDPPHPVPRWWIPFDIVCLFCFELCEATVPSMHNIFDNGGGKKTILRRPTQQSVPNPNHQPPALVFLPLTTARCVFCVTLLDCLYFVPPHMVDGPKQ